MSSDTAARMWRDYLETLGEKPETTGRKFSSWHFCDNEKDALELAGLVMEGKKRATAGALWAYEHEGAPLPEEGGFSVVTDFHGEAKCVIRTLSVSIVPFDRVTAEFACTEGEGDGSLGHWRKVHREFFARELEAVGKAFSEDMPVVCEEFELVHPRK